MLPVFVVWTVIYIFAAEEVTRLLGHGPSAPGEVYYIEAWIPWIITTLLWLAPVVVGLVLALVGVRHGEGRLAWVGVAIHGLLLAFFTIPNVIERILTL